LVRNRSGKSAEPAVKPGYNQIFGAELKRYNGRSEWIRKSGIPIKKENYFAAVAFAAGAAVVATGAGLRSVAGVE
jgi:hypothetical protein